MSKRYVGGIVSTGLDGINSPVREVEYLVVAGGGGAGGSDFNGSPSGGGGAVGSRCPRRARRHFEIGQRHIEMPKPPG